MEYMIIVSIEAENYEKAIKIYHENVKDEKLRNVMTVLKSEALQEILDNDKKLKELQKVLKSIIK